jgi:hypothetical protein
MTFAQANAELAAIAATQGGGAFSVQYKHFTYGDECGAEPDRIECRLYLGAPVNDAWEAQTWAEAFDLIEATLSPWRQLVDPEEAPLHDDTAVTTTTNPGAVQ